MGPYELAVSGSKLFFFRSGRTNACFSFIGKTPECRERLHRCQTTGAMCGVSLEVCGSTRTRGYTRPDPYPRVRVGSGRYLTGRVGYGFDVHWYRYSRFYP